MATGTERQLVSFKLAGEEFGVDIMQVQEIIKIPEITRVPKAPEFVEGVINLRGKVLPVVDSRRRFDLELKEWTDSDRILVVNVEGKITGIIVDSVSEVLRLSEDTIETAPSLIGEAACYLEGIGKLEGQGRLINLLNLQKFLAIEGMDEFSENLKSTTKSDKTKEEGKMDEKVISDEAQFVGFRLGEEEYAVGISEVQEIIRVPEITRVPKAPEFVEGVINLRGKVLPIISLRKKFLLENIEKTDSQRIIVVNIDGISTGMVVDSVSEVLRLPKDAIEPPPPILSGLDADHLQGIGKLNEGKRLLLLLDLHKLLTSSEKKQLSRLGEGKKNDDMKNRQEAKKMAEEEQLVSFKIENEEFGINIEEVQEIIRLPEITRVPQAPFFVEGVINLRGNILPVIDLRKRFDLEATQKTGATRIVVTNVDNKTTGIIVDSVSEVLRLPKDAIEPPPPIVAGIEAKYLRGIGKLNDGKRLLILLNLREILTVREEDKVKKMEKEAATPAKKKVEPSSLKLEEAGVKTQVEKGAEIKTKEDKKKKENPVSEKKEK
ncbi:chemotaxis protein CheW [Candidatus Aerophobetes bacterium]|nr:chemotaxis protein CheW [Candidatus Aerophobetes bacterium]